MTRLSVAAVLLTHAFAVTAVSHCHYFVKVPTRTEWFVAEFAVALLLWLPCRFFVRGVWSVAKDAPLTRLGGPAVLGLLVNVWWAGQLDRLLWIHVQTAQLILEPLFVIADWVSVSAVYAGVLALLVRTDPVVADASRARLRLAVNRSTILAFAMFLIAANVFAVWFVSSERTIYYWDMMGYWTWSAEFAETAAHSSAEGWDLFRDRVQRRDYGLLPAIIPATAMVAFGDHRLVYVLAIVNGHLLAVAIVMVAFVRRFAPQAGLVGVVLPLVMLLTQPLVWMPLVRGYLDIGGVALAVLAVFVYLSRPVTELRWQHIVTTAALLVALALFRRWYNFWVVAFLLMAGLEGVIVALRTGWRAVRPAVAVGAVSGMLLLSVAFPLVFNIVMMDYSTAYSSYRDPAPFLDRLAKLFDLSGWLLPAAIVGGALGLLIPPGTRRLALYLGGGAGVILLHFMRTQDFGPHHLYLFLPAFVLLPAVLSARLLSWRWGWLCFGLVAVWGIASMIAIHRPGSESLHAQMRPLVPLYPYPPLVRNDLDEVRRLMQLLDTETAASDESIVVLGSGPNFNQTTFLSARRSLRIAFEAENRFLPAPEVDRVNGFPAGVFEAGLVVVADPPQIHLRESEQQTVLIPARELLNGMGIGKAFDRLPVAFLLDHDVTVFVYRRVRPIDPVDFAAFREKLRQAHPDNSRVYSPPEPNH